jgi:hypothetical protein
VSTRGTVDIVFCLDASSSMKPCFDGMRNHIGEFVTSLQSNPQIQWDWRLDFVAHCAGDARGMAAHAQRSMYHEEVWHSLYQSATQSNRFFTDNLDDFKRRLAGITVAGDEAPLVALDICLDFPWRPAAMCHRVVILLTDEPAEDGVAVDVQRAAIPQLIDKIQRLKILLFIVAPDSTMFGQLAQVNKSEYEVLDNVGDGLSRVDFRQLLSAIGKSVSASTIQSAKDESIQRGLFGQSSWGRSNEELRGA